MGSRFRFLWIVVLVACSVPEERFHGLPDAGAGDAPADATPEMLSWNVTTDVGLGDIVLGQSSADQTITVANNGGTDSGTLAVSYDDTTLGFAINNDACSGHALPPHMTCSFTIRFTPVAAGPATTTLHVTDGTTDLARAVTGNGLTQGLIQISAMTYDFHTLAVDAAPVKQTFTISNGGQQTIGMPSFSTTGGDASYTVDSTTCTGPLTMTDTCTVTIAFDPASVGQKAGSLKASAMPGGDAGLTLAGTGTAHVTVVLGGTGTGHVGTTSVAGIDCGTLCDNDFSSTPVTLDATAGVGSTFTGWTGDCTGTGSCTLDLVGAKTVTASFTLNKYPLVVAPAGNGTGVVKADSGAINCGTTCTDSYDYNTVVTLTATPATGTTFTGWSGDCAGTGSCSVTMSQAHNVTATFTLNKETLTVTPAGTGTGTVVADLGAISCGGTCSDSYDYGTTVTLTATAATGSTFSSWAGCTTTSGATCTVAMTAVKNVTASFALGSYTLTIAKQGTGSVASSDGNISCGATCSHAYAYNASVSLTATPGTGYHFDHWSGGPCDASTNATCTLAMPAANTTTTAIFAIDTHTVTVTINGTGSGTVASNVGGIACPGTCTGTYNYNTQVTLTATATGGATVTWAGCDSSTATTCTVTVTAARAVTATFNAGPQTLTVMAAGNGLGTVTSSPAGISCPTTCTSTFTFDQTVTLTATPQGAATFAGWSGDCTGSATTCTVTMSQARTVTATFSAGDQTLTLAQSGTGSGSFNLTPAPVTVSGNVYTYHYNATVQITAAPGSTSTFASWSGDCAGQGATCTLTMDRAHSATATFTLVTKRLQLSLTSPNGGTGNVTPSPVGTPCPAPAVRCWDYPYGTPVTLTATPDPGSSFYSWSTCAGTGTCGVTMTADTTETATFVTNYTLSVTDSGDGSGSVTGSPGGVNGTINCGSGSSTGCSADYAGVTPATSVTLTASAANGSQFTSWSGACTGTSTTCSVSMSAARSVTATFTKIYDLTATATGTGSVSVTSGIGSCGTSCTQYLSGTAVTISATPGNGYYFAGWTGDCAGQGQNCSLTMSANHTASATFSPLQQLTVTRQGSGTVTSDDGKINCGTTCQASYVPSPTVTLSATPASGSTFAGWSGGGCSGTGTCMVTMNTAQNVTAIFYYNVNIGSSGSGSASTATTGGIACSASPGYSQCVAFATGSLVTITEAPANGNFMFGGWTGACATQGATCQIQTNAPQSTIATFSPVPYPVSVSVSGSGAIVLNGVAYGNGAQPTFPYGSLVSASAAPGGGWGLTGVSGVCSTLPCSFTMTGPTSIGASYAVQYTLSVTANIKNVVTGPGINCGSTCSAVEAGTVVLNTDIGNACTNTDGPGNWTATNCTCNNGASCVFDGTSGSCTVSSTASTTVTFAYQCL